MCNVLEGASLQLVKATIILCKLNRESKSCFTLWVPVKETFPTPVSLLGRRLKTLKE